MLTNIDITNWTPFKVRDWLIDICNNDSNWLKVDKILSNNIDGRKLLNFTHQDIEMMLGANKINKQEEILEAIEKLRDSYYDETLQSKILKLSCQSRSLHKQLISENSLNLENQHQRVSLDTLAAVSEIVTIVKNITDKLNSLPFSKFDDYRSMKSLILALSIELTSTAQRDQFVEKPNDIIEKSSKALADYCDRIVYGTCDPLLIQIETDRIRKNHHRLIIHS